MDAYNYLEITLDIIDKYNINLIQIIFLAFTAIVIFFGALLILIEPYLPSFIRQSYRYGKHCFKGKKLAYVELLEVPKSWFKHFYVFAFSWSILTLYLVLKTIIFQSQAPEYVIVFLDLMSGGRKRKVETDTTFALIGTVLMTMQCMRRFYETNFVQIFSKKSKINVSHYFVGYFHYFGAIIALVANTQGFVRGTLPTTFSFNKLTFLQFVCFFCFYFSWIQQYKANMILVNLRKDAKTGQVKTENHLMPKGGVFEFISSPHMFFEIAMYFSLYGFFLNSVTWVLITLWVACNQIPNAYLTHQWYKENFKNYPKDRYALFPLIL